MTYIARTNTYTKNGRFVERGQLIEDGEVDFVEGKSEDHLVEADGIESLAVVQMSSIAPTGPNPQIPQQIPADGYQTPGGYGQPGAKLVGEVTVKAEERIDDAGIDPEDTTQGDVVDALEKADADAQEKARKDAEAAAKAESKAAKAKPKVEVTEG